MEGGARGASLALARLVHGWKEVPKAPHSPWLAVARSLASPVSFMLLLTIVLAGYLRKFETMGMVAALLILNTAVGAWEESRTAAAVEALLARLVIEARVLRRGDGWVAMPARELVPGDVVRVKAGDVVPADLAVLAIEARRRQRRRR